MWGVDVLLSAMFSYFFLSVDLCAYVYVWSNKITIDDHRWKYQKWNVKEVERVREKWSSVSRKIHGHTVTYVHSIDVFLISCTVLSRWNSKRTRNCAANTLFKLVIWFWLFLPALKCIDAMSKCCLHSHNNLHFYTYRHRSIASSTECGVQIKTNIH